MLSGSAAGAAPVLFNPITPYRSFDTRVFGPGGRLPAGFLRLGPDGRQRAATDPFVRRRGHVHVTVTATGRRPPHDDPSPPAHDVSSINWMTSGSTLANGDSVQLGLSPPPPNGSGRFGERLVRRRLHPLHHRHHRLLRLTTRLANVHRLRRGRPCFVATTNAVARSILAGHDFQQVGRGRKRVTPRSRPADRPQLADLGENEGERFNLRRYTVRGPVARRAAPRSRAPRRRRRRPPRRSPWPSVRLQTTFRGTVMFR